MPESMSEDAFFAERDKLEEEIAVAQASNDHDGAERLYRKQRELYVRQGNGPIIDGVRTA